MTTQVIAHTPFQRIVLSDCSYVADSEKIITADDGDVDDLIKAGCTMSLSATGIMSGVLADRPNSSSLPAGNIYIATDTLTVYRDNGTSWDMILGTTGARGS